MKPTAAAAAAATMPRVSLVMGAQDLRLVVLLVAVLFDHHQVAAALPDQRIGNSASNIYPSRDALAFDGVATESSLRPESSSSYHQTFGADQPYQLEEQTDEQRTLFPMFIPFLRNLRIKDIDQVDNYKLLPSSKVLDEILNEISQELAGPEQQKRTTRTYSYGGGGGSTNRRQQVTAIDQPSIYNKYVAQTSQQQQQTPRRLAVSNNRQPQLSMLELDGLPSSISSNLWPQQQQQQQQSTGRTLTNTGPSGRVGNARRSHATTNPRHTSDTAEIAISTPLKSRSVSEYDWKRVENSRWNNLRGMWGKRSVPLDGAADEDSAESSQGAENRQKQRAPSSSSSSSLSESASENKQQRMGGNFM